MRTKYTDHNTANISTRGQKLEDRERSASDDSSHSSMKTTTDVVAMTTVVHSYLLRALHISMTTSTDKAMVIGLGCEKILQSMLGNILGSAGHCM